MGLWRRAGVRSLSGKRCLVTGAASGIGRATAVLAAERGARLVLTDVRGEDLAAVATEIERRGGVVLASRALDIADHGAVKDLAERVHADHGSVDVVMNVAGISVWGALEHLSHEDWRRVMEINLMGPIHVLESFVPAMIRAGRGGHVVNVSSAAGLFGLPLHAAYSASKFGLRGVSEVLRFELAEHGIGVSLVCPGGVRTGLVQTVKIVGLDAASDDVRRLRARFERHAVTPEVAARAIVRGVERNTYLVFTSGDIRWGHWVQQRFALPYELAMWALQRRVRALAKADAR